MKRKLLFAIVALLCAVSSWAQASYNMSWTDGVAVGEGSDYFLYNIGAGQFLTGGMDWGSHASADHAGKVVTLSKNTNGYKIYTAYKSANGVENSGYLATDGYTDGVDDADWLFIPATVDGYTNVYTIKLDDSKYLYYDPSDTRVQIGTNPDNNYSKWIIVPMTDRDAKGDYTYYLQNQGINRFWERACWAGCTWGNDKFGVGGNANNPCGEKYKATIDFSQTITETVPEGRYKLFAQGFYRNESGSNAAPNLYANTDTEPLMMLTGTENTMNDASTSFTSGMYVNSVETFVKDGQLKVGIKVANNTQWVIFDNFVLKYLGQCVMDYAVELPASGDMDADTWYYFDIAVAGDNYDATATTLGNIICTDDGHTLTSATSGSITLTAENNGLAVKRYYVKSSSANKLKVAPKSFTYELGSITAQSIAEGEYIKSLTTFVVTYGDAATSDGSASLAIIGSPVATLTKDGATVTTGTLTADNSAKTLTATFSAVDLVLNSNDYSITIPAGAFGYEGQVTNAAITLNFNTPLFAGGTFYMKNKGNSAYLAAGQSWSSQSITNTIGHVVDIAALPNGKFSIDTHINNGGDDHYLGSNLYCDAGQEDWTFASDGDGGYTISNGNGYLQANGVGAALSQNASTSAATNWTLMTPGAWKTEQVTRLDAAAADNGVDATFYLPAANFNRNDNENSKWNGGPGFGGTNENYNAEKYNTTPFDVYQELTDLKPGVYKVSMNGFYRNGTTDDRNAILYANSYEVALLNIRSTQIAANDDAKGFTTQNGEYWVPNKQNEAALTFNNGYYINELYFTVGAAGTLRIGVKKTTGAAADWAIFDNFQLTYYGEVTTISEEATSAPATAASANVTLTRTLKGGQWNGFSVPFGFTVAGSALDGAEVKQFSSVTDNEITLADATEIVAGEPYLVKPASDDIVNPTFFKVAVSNPAESVKGTGDYTFQAHLYNTTLATDGSVAYVSTSDSSIKKLTSGGIKGLRAIFNVPTGSSVKALQLNFEDGTTSIVTVDAEGNFNEGAIYNVAGQRVAKAQKGLYIINGRKVVIK